MSEHPTHHLVLRSTEGPPLRCTCKHNNAAGATPRTLASLTHTNPTSPPAAAPRSHPAKQPTAAKTRRPNTRRSRRNRARSFGTGDDGVSPFFGCCMRPQTSSPQMGFWDDVVFVTPHSTPQPKRSNLHDASAQSPRLGGRPTPQSPPLARPAHEVPLTTTSLPRQYIGPGEDDVRTPMMVVKGNSLPLSVTHSTKGHSARMMPLPRRRSLVDINTSGVDFDFLLAMDTNQSSQAKLHTQNSQSTKISNVDSVTYASIVISPPSKTVTTHGNTNRGQCETDKSSTIKHCSMAVQTSTQDLTEPIYTSTDMKTTETQTNRTLPSNMDETMVLCSCASESTSNTKTKPPPTPIRQCSRLSESIQTETTTVVNFTMRSPTPIDSLFACVRKPSLHKSDSSTSILSTDSAKKVTFCEDVSICEAPSPLYTDSLLYGNAQCEDCRPTDIPDIVSFAKSHPILPTDTNYNKEDAGDETEKSTKVTFNKSTSKPQSPTASVKPIQAIPPLSSNNALLNLQTIANRMTCTSSATFPSAVAPTLVIASNVQCTPAITDTSIDLANTSSQHTESVIDTHQTMHAVSEAYREELDVNTHKDLEQEATDNAIAYLSNQPVSPLLGLTLTAPEQYVIPLLPTLASQHRIDITTLTHSITSPILSVTPVASSKANTVDSKPTVDNLVIMKRLSEVNTPKLFRRTYSRLASGDKRPVIKGVERERKTKSSENIEDVVLDLDIAYEFVKNKNYRSSFIGDVVPSKETQQIYKDHTCSDVQTLLRHCKTDSVYALPQPASFSQDTIDAVKRITTKYNTPQRYKLQAPLFESSLRKPVGAVSPTTAETPTLTCSSNQPTRQPILNSLTVRELARLNLFYRSFATEICICTCQADVLCCLAGPNEEWTHKHTGRPLLVLNTGAGKRRRQLQLVVAHPGTALPLWSDYITYLSNMTSVESPSPEGGVMHTLHQSTSLRHKVGLRYHNAEAGEEFFKRYQAITADPSDALWMVTEDKNSKKGKKQKRKKIPVKSGISQPCHFAHVTHVDMSNHDLPPDMPGDTQDRHPQRIRSRSLSE